MDKPYTPATPYAKLLARELGVDLAHAEATGVYGAVRAADVRLAAEHVSPPVTPLARRMAEQLGYDLAKITGTGYRGKITKADILDYQAGTGETAVKTDVSGPTTGGRRVPLKGMRKVVARRMLQSHLEIPPVTHTVKVDVTALMEARAKLKAAGKSYSVNDFVLLAVARALDRHRDMLVSLEGEEIVYKDRVNIGMAVALDEGLIVPVIRDAEQMDIDAISAAAKDLASRARGGKLSPDEYAGSTFSVSNLGMYDVEAFTPIINQPDAAILGVCAIQDELQLVNGLVAVRRVMRTCLTYDHRLMDGAGAAQFQREIKRLLENPIEIIL